MPVNIKPKVDYAFKWLFGREKNLPLLLHLLNAVLKTEKGSEIIALELLSPFSDKDAPDDKQSIVDVKARDQNGRLFDFEMQMGSTAFFKNRIVYYWARLHQQQLKEGDEYENLRSTISVCIADFILFGGRKGYCKVFELCAKESDLVFCSDIKVITLELPKFSLKPNRITCSLEAWLYFLRWGDKLDREKLPTELNRPEICKALEELEMLSQDEKERARYEARFRALTDERNRLNASKGFREEGRREGLAEGLAKGLAEGLAEGLAQGLEEGRQRLASAAIGQLEQRLGPLPDSVVEQIGDLQTEQIELLIKALNNFTGKDELLEWLRH